MVAELDPAELSLMFIVVLIPNIIISLLLVPSLAGVFCRLHVSYCLRSKPVSPNVICPFVAMSNVKGMMT